MKKIYYSIFLLAALIFTACESGSNEDRDVTRLGQVIWNEARTDIEFVAEALVDVLNFNYVLTTDDPIEKHQRFEYFFGADSELIESDILGSYTINVKRSNGSTLRSTSYNTHRTDFGKGVWEIKRISGDSYDIKLTPIDSQYIKAEFTQLSHVESSGYAELIFRYDYKPTMLNPNDYLEAFVLYEGWIELVDEQTSSSAPITLRSETTAESCYSFNQKFGDSSLLITCHDAMCGVTDTVAVKIVKSPKRAIITCYGVEFVLQM
jgi:hypothetical protein